MQKKKKTEMPFLSKIGAGVTIMDGQVRVKPVHEPTRL